MDKHFLFGIFIFETNASVIYRYLTDDLHEHLLQSFKKKRPRKDDDTTDENLIDNDNEVQSSFDDDITEHLSKLVQVFHQSTARHDPIRRVVLHTGIQLFFEQIADKCLICMADKTFETILVLKTINLLKALIKFHIGALPFGHYNLCDQLINRISASLQYFLDNIKTSQALLFESCEHLLINADIRDQCRDVCTMISNDVQNMVKVPQKMILITCNDKLVHMYISPDQSRPNNADIFLLLLNNTSKPLRKEFACQISKGQIFRHRVLKKKDHQTHSQTTSTRTSTDSASFSASDRTQSCPNIPSNENMTSTESNNETIHGSEVVFLRTSNRAIAPFTLFTIPLTNQMSMLILVEWENSTVCSNLFDLIRHLDSCIAYWQLPYNTLSPQVKAVESSAAVRRFFEQKVDNVNSLTYLLNEAYALHKTSAKMTGKPDQKTRNGSRILDILRKMSVLSVDAFRHLFFDSDEYAHRCGVDIERYQETEVQMDGVGFSDTGCRRNEYDTSKMTKKFRKRIRASLEDLFSFIEVKSQRNITMTFCHNEFPGLVHFVFIDRFRGNICSPALVVDENLPTDECCLEKKILAFEVECLKALHQGFTSYTMSDEHFTYNYTLQLQESNGALVRLHKSFVQAHPPSVLHVDFYKALSEECYPWLAYQTSIACVEFISVHLRLVPATVVLEQCELLWRKLKEPFE